MARLYCGWKCEVRRNAVGAGGLFCGTEEKSGGTSQGIMVGEWGGAVKQRGYQTWALG